MGSEVAGRADFAAIRYAQCWEDADILVEALDVRPGDVCLSHRLRRRQRPGPAQRGPARVIALDLSPAQLACVELRVAAYRTLRTSRTAGADRLAARVSGGRELYAAAGRCCRAEARDFWDAAPARRRGRHRRGRQVRALLRPVPHAACCRWSIAGRQSRRCCAAAPRERGGSLLRADTGTPGAGGCCSASSSRASSWAGWAATRASSATSRGASPTASSRGPVRRHRAGPGGQPVPAMDPDGPAHGTALPFALRPENFDAIRAQPRPARMALPVGRGLPRPAASPGSVDAST